jgi:hypothetical protein
MADTPAPQTLERVVSGLEQFVVSDISDGTGELSVRLTAAGATCSVIVNLVSGDDVGLFYPSSGYPWVVSFSQ